MQWIHCSFMMVHALGDGKFILCCPYHYDSVWVVRVNVIVWFCIIGCLRITEFLFQKWLCLKPVPVAEGGLVYLFISVRSLTFFVLPSVLLRPAGILTRVTQAHAGGSSHLMKSRNRLLLAAWDSHSTPLKTFLSPPHALPPCLPSGELVTCSTAFSHLNT